MAPLARQARPPGAPRYPPPGGPYRATTAPATSSVGTAAFTRFARPVAYQGFPDAALPIELRNANEYSIWRMVNGEMTRGAIEETA